jgi:hypothetical protein
MSKRSLIMKQYSKLFSLVLLGSTAVALADCCSNNNSGGNNCVIPFIQWRSQGRNMARKLEGTTSYAVYQGDMDNTYGTFNIAVEYDQTFRGHQIARCLFGDTLVNAPAVTPTNNNCSNNCSNSCDSTLIVSGLNANGLGTGRAVTDLMAENFLLPRDFKSAISFSPKVQSVIVDFNLFVGLDRWVNGLYFRLYGPVVWNKSGLRASENIINPGTAAGLYPQGYFDPFTPVANTALFQSALNFFGGCQLPAYPTPASNYSVNVAPLKFAKFSDCNLNNNNNNNNCSNSCNGTSHHKTGFAELRGEFGWNYITDKYRLMLNIQAAAPTGTRPNAEFLLPAYVGNGKHWELGGGVGGSWMMWQSEDGERSFNFIVEADITHLFKAKQKMTFDLKGKPLSRYMLAEQLVVPANADSQLVPATLPTFEIEVGKQGVYMPVANFSTRDVKVSFGVQGDVVAMFNYTHRGFSWDIGYNFWGMSCSEVSLSCDNDCSNNNNNSCNAAIINPFPTNMALKGDASIAGYNPSNATGEIFGLSATENGATIFNGTNIAKATAAQPPLSNPGVDNAQFAVGNAGGTTPPTDINLFVFANPAATTQISTSNPPVFISIDDLDVEGAEQRGLSNKVFTHFNYTWTDRDRWVPYVGAGFSAEFGNHCGSNDDCNNTPVVTTPSNNNSGCNSCKKCALTQWGVEIKGGVSFH